MIHTIATRVARALLLSAALAAPLAAEEAANLPIERYALYVASNDGGAKRVALKYAGTDAVRIARTMSEIGGVPPQNSLILTDPSRAQIDDAFARMRRTIERNGGKARRTEFLFYYSGHSDEKAFLLGRDSYPYAELKEALNAIPTDVHVVMLDSCYSGNFVRAKGGSRQKPFLIDDSTVVQGHAYLSSSSEHEASQESDRIQASYFTHALVSGLRGAADASGDGKVSLNELYHYAFNETLSQTERSSVGPQHPSYNITLVGSGDLVLTDITDAESVLVIPKENEGRYFIRAADGTLVSEINKVSGNMVALALPAGTYSVIVVTSTGTLQGTVNLSKGGRVALDASAFGIVPRTYDRARGDGVAPLSTEEELAAEAARARAAALEAAGQTPPAETTEPEAAAKRWLPFQFTFVPGLSIPRRDSDNVVIGLGLLMSHNKNIRVAQVSGFLGSINGSLTGIQASGFLNTADGTLAGSQIAGFMNSAISDSLFTGGQIAGFLNTAKAPILGAQIAGFLNISNRDLRGAQVSGFMNFSRGRLTGVQYAGFLNVASEVSGVQFGVVNVARKNSGASIGLLNFILDGIISPAIYVDSNQIAYVQYQGGTNYFYTTFLLGIPFKGAESEDDLDCAIFGIGAGTRIQATKRLSFDIEVLSKWVLDADTGIGGTFHVNYDPDDESDEPEFVSEGYQDNCVPSLRVTANFAFMRHLSAFASVGLDFEIDGFNEWAFDRVDHGMSFTISEDKVWAHPSVSVGLKF
ncbi:MAG TPA: caspase family protein [Treponemataceae bacterium]|nr:caspase family protein [Treponemataceae bacterium]